MPQKILFLTTAHHYNDDRIFYHQAQELALHGDRVKIVSLSSDFVGNLNRIEIESYNILNEVSSKKIQKFIQIIEEFQPQTILCSEPLAVVAAKKSKIEARIIYDVTEWYPSKRMLAPYSFFFKPIHYIKFLLIQLYSGWISNAFIFGEEAKKYPLAFVFPFKPKIILPYYPDKKYISEKIKELNPESITLCYTGIISKEKGFENFINVIKELQKSKPDVKVKTLIIGKVQKEEDYFFLDNYLRENPNVTIIPTVAFTDFSNSIKEADICFDLREINQENHRCLPIKIFYYMASGKPFIYSNLNAIRNHFDTKNIGFLVEPTDYKKIVGIIDDYLSTPDLYNTHAKNAVKIFNEKLSWESIKARFLEFVKPHTP